MQNVSNNKHWQDFVNLALGAWLIAAPWAADFHSGFRTDFASGSAVIMGVAVLIVSIAGIVNPDVWEEWINLLLGFVLVVSPITVGYAGHTTAVWNAVVTGLIIAALSILSLRQQIQYTPRAARGSGDTMGQRAQPR